MVKYFCGYFKMRIEENDNIDNRLMQIGEEFDILFNNVKECSNI